MTKERPILFSGEMVKSILGGQKTMTRRILKVDGRGIAPSFTRVEYKPGLNCINAADRTNGWIEIRDCPYGKVGDQLWVRETFMYADPISRIDYKADGKHILHHSNEACKKFADVFERNPDNIGRWYPSIHMPRWASRILLEITDIRVERLQDISEEDARKEGVLFKDNGDLYRGLPAKQAFASLWESINLGTWTYNPWVWVVSFRKIERRASE